ncbi:hypothetical protein CASFOL_004887 [Castilleja foliolosa]|uniref:RNase H type-1 domain-containing protein n=1 Tax=Castilleja foliolosa TaxID=1961234 RepID=A0ABD3EBR8_9LAMI
MVHIKITKPRRIIRNHKGDMVAAFWCTLHTSDVDTTEMMVVAKRIDLCRQLGIENVQIETDSMAVVKASRNNTNNPDESYLTRKYRTHLNHTHHIRREQNGASNLLAKKAILEKENTSKMIGQLPLKLEKRSSWIASDSITFEEDNKAQLMKKMEQEANLGRTIWNLLIILANFEIGK